jgi:hypothetical protein
MQPSESWLAGFLDPAFRVCTATSLFIVNIPMATQMSVRIYKASGQSSALCSAKVYPNELKWRQDIVRKQILPANNGGKHLPASILPCSIPYKSLLRFSLTSLVLGISIAKRRQSSDLVHFQQGGDGWSIKTCV